jgi:hypothetical protein
MVWTNPSSLYPVLGGDSIGSEEEGCPFESDRLIWLFRGDAAPSTIQWWNADTSSYDEVLLETDYTVVVGGPGGVTTVWQYDIPVTTTPYVDIPKDGTTGEHAGLYRITTNATLSTDTGPFVEKDALIDVYNTTETSSQLKVRLADGTTPAAVINQPYAKVLLHRSLAPEVVMETGRGKSDYPQDLYVDVLENNPSWATYASVIRLHYKTLSYTANFLGDVRFYYTPRHTLFRLRYDNGALTGATIKRQKVTIQPTSAYDVSVYNDGEVWIFHNDSGTPDAVGGELVDYGSPVSNLDLTADLNVGHWAARYTIKYGATDTPAHLWRQVNGPTLKSMAPFKDALVQFYCPDIGTGSRTVQYLVADSSSSSPSFESIILKNMYELWHFARGQSAVRIMTSNISR